MYVRAGGHTQTDRHTQLRSKDNLQFEDGSALECTYVFSADANCARIDTVESKGIQGQ